MLTIDPQDRVIENGRLIARRQGPDVPAARIRGASVHDLTRAHSVARAGRRALWLVVALGLAFCFWYAGTPVLKGSETSPMKAYRVDYYDASPMQRALHRQMKTPSVVRLYRAQPEALLAQSEVVDLWMNGTLHWWTDPPTHAVVVGSSVVFENIPAECPSASGCPR